jgi:hypothetical protein
MLHRALQQPLGSSWRCIALSAATRLPLMLMHPHAYTFMCAIAATTIWLLCQGQNDGPPKPWIRRLLALFYRQGKTESDGSRAQRVC